MDCSESDIKVNKLQHAVIHGDQRKVRKLLDEGAIPNYKPGWWRNKMIRLAIRENHTKVVKLFIHYEDIEIDRELINYIFAKDNSQHVRELLTLVIRNHENGKLIEKIFFKLVYTKHYDKTLALDILKLLLEHGLPTDDFIGGSDFTPLHLSVKNRKTDFVSLLLERGADINKKRKNGNTFLHYLVELENYETMAELLLKKGLEINGKSLNGQTALHRACELDKPEITRTLLKYGADVNILDRYNKTPLFCASSTRIMEIMIQELAKLKFECQSVCLENLEYIRFAYSGQLQIFFEGCLDELQEMKNQIFYFNFSFFEIFKMQKQCKKLISLTKNEDFVAEYFRHRKQKSFGYYGKDLDDIFRGALERKVLLMYEENKLYSVFKHILPDLVIRKIAHFTNEDIIFNEL